MAAVTFDTLKFVKTLEAAGVSAPQAEAISSAVRDAHETAEVATKRDLHELELRMDTRFERMQGKLNTMHGELKTIRGEFRGMENRILLKVGGMLAATFALTLTGVGILLAFFGHFGHS
jgi:hypothetical protein